MSHDPRDELHQQADGDNGDPAAKSQGNGFAAVFHQFDHIRVQSDGSHGHDDEELAERLERSEYRCVYTKSRTDGGNETGDDEPQDEHGKRALEAEVV